MATKLGTLSHAKGFVIHKLRKQRKFGGSHVPVQFLSEGYPLEWRHLITEAVRQLKNEKAIHVEKKRTGRSNTPHAKLTKNGLAMKRGLLNA